MSNKRDKPAKSKKQSDGRLKIIALEQSFTGIDVAASKSLLWPCYSYTATIPKPRKRDFNIFEETVLKLVGETSGDVAVLSDLTCMERDLVSFILRRLEHYNLLDSRNQLTEGGRNVLGRFVSESNEYMVVNIYVDRMTGNLLNFVSTKALEFETPDKISDFSVLFHKGTGSKKPFYADRLNERMCSSNIHCPDSNDIVRILSSFRRKLQRYMLLNRNSDISLPPIPNPDSITIDKKQNPESVYFHCYALIPKGNPEEILITDGVGCGFSADFMNYVRENGNGMKWIRDLRDSAIVENSSTKRKKVADIAIPGFNGETLAGYKEIESLLKKAERHYKDFLKNAESTVEEQKRNQLYCTIVTSLYELLEWALRYVVFENNTNSAISVFSSQDFRANEYLLLELAKKIGFDIPKNHSFLQVKPGAIKKLLDNGHTEMQPLLAMAIAGASCDLTHPFKRLAQYDRRVLDFIGGLKLERDPIMHGDTDDISSSLDKKEHVDSIKQRVYEIIWTLFPKFHLQVGADTLSFQTFEDTSDYQDETSQVRLKAGNELCKVFGTSFQQNVNSNVWEELIKVASFMLDTTQVTESTNQIINSLASTLQIITHEAYSGISGFKQKQNQDMVIESFEKARRTGVIGETQVIPTNLAGTNVKRIISAIRGENTTLGSNLIALLYTKSQEEMIRLAERLKTNEVNIVSVVGDLLSLRGHGNNQSIQMTAERLKELKDNVFLLIKILKED